MSDESNFPWPKAEQLIGDFIPTARLVESGRYLKVSLLSEPDRVITVFMDEARLLKELPDMIDGSEGFYEGSSEERVRKVLAVDLFERLDSMSPEASQLFYRNGFHELS